MAYNDILNELKAKLGDSKEENVKILRAEAEGFAKSGDIEGMRAAGELIMENMSDDQKEEINRLTHIDGKRLDEAYKDIVELINQKDFIQAKSLAEKLYKKILLDYSESDTAIFVSLRNPFEDNLYQYLFKPEKTLNRAPFDFAAYLTTYAYILVETGSTVDAIPILERAVQYNPVDVGPKFELTEIYKLIKNKKKVFETTRETLHVASSPVAIARCYANIGYALMDSQDYEDAAVFYTASAMFAPNPAVPLEMQHLADLKGTPIVRPSHEKIVEVMKKYDIEFGPDKDVISVAAQLASNYLINKDIPNALKALKITYNLTLDEEVKNIILKYEPNAAMAVPKPQEDSAQENRQNITVKTNENPES